MVTLLTGILASLTLQSLQHVLQIESRFAETLTRTREGEMYAEWYRRSVVSAVPEFEGGANPFRGSPREFSGLTLQPLSSAGPALAPFGWRLRFEPDRGETWLLYGADEGDPILAWPGNVGRFLYVDRDGKAHDSWPPPLGAWPQLPKAVHLEAADGLGPSVIIAVPRGLEDPRPRRLDFKD